MALWHCGIVEHLSPDVQYFCFLSIVSTGYFVLAGATQAGAVSLTYNTSIGRPADLTKGEIPGAPGTLAVPQGITVQSGTRYQ